MKEEIKKDLVRLICNDYIDLILVGIEEYSKYFPYTICCCNFLSDLKKRNITTELNAIFIDKFIDKVYKEFSNYIGGRNFE